MIQFFAPDIESTGILPPEDSLHCIRVLRHHPGDMITVINGRGHRFECRIISDDPRATAIDIISSSLIKPHWGCSLWLAVAPTKNMDRMEWMVEKAVEIGVDRITPVLCAHSERKVLKTERLHKIAVAAMKQSLKTTLPIIDPLTPIQQFLKMQDHGQKFMGYCDAAYPRLLLAREYKPAADATLLIGPEGDFSPEEVDMAVAAGFIPATFGQSRLRTETAAIVALDTLHIVSSLASGPAAESAMQGRCEPSIPHDC
ncbi:MAG: 16S rRNA (uracil(1498)-N(3))-methyltransferase [Muribaculaceae bacterium]